MLTISKIDDIVARIARRRLPAAGLERVMSEATVSSMGSEALKITLVIKEDTVARVSGDAALNILVDVRNSLEAAGEERLPILEYATEKELSAVGMDD